MDKKINNDLQNATQKTKHWATRIWMENLITWYDGFNGFSNIIFMYLRVSEWVSEWVRFISAISWREQVNFQCDNDGIRLVLDQHA
jgi:hypothetical protein